MRAREHGFWGGVTDDPEPGAGRLGIERWAERGIVGRGVLLDVEGGDPFASRSISPEELEAAAGRQGVELRPGDVLCVRTGWMARYRRLDADERRRAATSHAFAGLAAGEEMARWLWDHRFAAVACDNPAVEVSPGDRDVEPLISECRRDEIGDVRLVVHDQDAGSFLGAGLPRDHGRARRCHLRHLRPHSIAQWNSEA